MKSISFAALNDRMERGGPYAKATFAGAVFLAVFLIGYLATSHPPYDA
jgi:hypothetical protein